MCPDNSCPFGIYDPRRSTGYIPAFLNLRNRKDNKDDGNKYRCLIFLCYIFSGIC